MVHVLLLLLVILGCIHDCSCSSCFVVLIGRVILCVCAVLSISVLSSVSTMINFRCVNEQHNNIVGFFDGVNTRIYEHLLKIEI